MVEMSGFVAKATNYGAGCSERSKDLILPNRAVGCVLRTVTPTATMVLLIRRNLQRAFRCLQQTVVKLHVV